MDIDWDLLIQQEAEIGGKEAPRNIIEAYDQDESILALEDEEQEDPYSDNEDDDFSVFAERDPDLVLGYAQREHISYGGGGLGTTIGGKMSKIERMIQAQNASPQEMYLNKLKLDLQDYFSIDKSSHYAARIQEVPRFITKNSLALAATIYMIDGFRGNKPTNPKLKLALENVSAESGIRKEDLLRYYRLLEKYSLY